MKEALFYEKQSDGSVICGLCPHVCRIAESGTGFCGVRVNTGGTLFAENYGRISSLNLDPIEKKPLAGFYPGSLILSAGSYGCNMKCEYCQNYAISQHKPETKEASPEELLYAAGNTSGNIGMAFTYNEPLVGIEYILDAAPLLKDAGLKVVLVTNGLINAGPLEVLLPYVDAMNIDVKAFNPEQYKKLGGDFSTVLKTVEKSAAACHVEVTSLIVPGQNDNVDDILGLAEWLADISAEIPLHISRFFPRYKASGCEPTPVQTMKTLADAARKTLKHVYLGNV
ncbi:MAG: AmmeMemoRadiSam system radical SAM enzyme [Acidobacteriota bacterium]|jgi:pyruvate formate lyase activating enzyme|nr:AmmeMemoRadiSam system radical SAM enzyme [Acidobacteriota bacterium]